MSKPYLFLAVAILCEVIATSAMKSSHGFTRLVPSIFTVLMYCVSFYALSQTLAVIPTGIESPRFLRRLNTLRGLSHEEDEQVLARGA